VHRGLGLQHRFALRGVLVPLIPVVSRMWQFAVWTSVVLACADSSREDGDETSAETSTSTSTDAGTTGGDTTSSETSATVATATDNRRDRYDGKRRLRVDGSAARRGFPTR